MAPVFNLFVIFTQRDNGSGLEVFERKLSAEYNPGVNDPGVMQGDIRISRESVVS